MVVRLIGRISVQWAAVSIDYRHIGDFDALIVWLVVIAELSIDRDDIAPVGEIRPSSDDAGGTYQIIFLRNLVLYMRHAEWRANCHEMVNPELRVAATQKAEHIIGYD